MVPEYEVVPVQHVRKRSVPDETENLIDHGETAEKAEKPYEKEKMLDVNKKNLRLKAFGRPISLSLVPNEGLLKKGKLKIWTIEPNATAQHGVEYVELPEVLSTAAEGKATIAALW
ncbi:hypothetical protein NQ318_005368 [Aromia moschata]|uniref:Uncharacterized protein n=1 Tax=Aromia moschata TaxID=1265417 RepID=A0AAV8YY49_9CUCU|nr:hypothetical protein NQ318_005368 [Aromia moschata]